MTVKQDLKALQKEIKALEKKVAKRVKAIQAVGRRQAQKAPPAQNAKARRTAKSAVEAAPVKMTAADRVLKVIKGSKEGIDTTALMKATGFKNQKIRSILSRIFKEGKVKRTGRGIYVAA
ncbi:MAG: hypothetical protein JSW39_27610 [Desulfobacterales bacterium]|nr:MAG: hypothetical protein JSW39_27610 [Desulfobacterales bacterium]